MKRSLALLMAYDFLTHPQEIARAPAFGQDPFQIEIGSWQSFCPRLSLGVALLLPRIVNLIAHDPVVADRIAACNCMLPV